MIGAMNKGRRRTTPPATQKPVDAATGAPLVRKFMLKLFDREDGHAADWPMIAETLLREAFHALDQAPTDPRTLAMLRRVHTGTYDRLAGNKPDSATPPTFPSPEGRIFQPVAPNAVPDPGQ